jgi:tetratricopeptide (TPR) repeat protein
MGKTTAAIDAARRAMKSGDFGVVRWMTAATPADLEAAWRSLGADLGVAGLSDVKARRELVRRVVTEGLDRMARGSWLLAFDNVEKLTDELRELMPVWADVETPRAHVMVTTRDRTGWAGSHAAVIEVSEMKRGEAVELLADRAGIDRSAPEQSNDLGVMVERLGRHPLALMQVGALIREGCRTVKSFLKELVDEGIAIDRLTYSGIDRPEGKAHPIEESVRAALGKILEVAIGRIGESESSDTHGLVESANQLLDHYAVMNPDRIEDWIFEADKDSGGGDIKPFLHFIDSRNTLMRLGLVTPGPEPGSVRMHRLTQEVIRVRTLASVDGDVVKVGVRSRWIVERLRGVCPEDDTSLCLQRMRTLLLHMDRVWAGGRDDVGNPGEGWVHGVGSAIVGAFLKACGFSHLQLGESQLGKELLEQALAHFQREYGPAHRIVASTLSSLGIAYGDLGNPTKQKELSERALEIFEREDGPDHPGVAVTLTNLSNAYGALGDPAKQKELLERALSIKEQEYGPDHREVAVTLTNLSNAHGALGDLAKQKELLERALAIDVREYGPDHRNVTGTLVNLGIVHSALGDPAKAKDLLMQSLAIQQREYGPDHRVVAITLANLGCAYGNLGEPTKRKEFLERALVIDEREFGLDHRNLVFTLANLGNTHCVLGDPEKGKALLERALVIQAREFGSDHVNVASTLTALGNAHSVLGDPVKGKALLERALVIQEREFGSDHLNVVNTLTALGSAHSVLGNPAKLTELLERALVIEVREYGPDHRNVATTLVNLGFAHGVGGDQARQRELLERALPILEREFGPDHQNVAITLVNLSSAYGDLDEPTKKMEALERALPILEREYGPDHREVAITLTNLANAHGALGDPEKQKELLERALTTIVRDCGPIHRIVGSTCVKLGMAYGALGDLANQKELLERALAIQEQVFGLGSQEACGIVVELLTAVLHPVELSLARADPAAAATALDALVDDFARWHVPDSFLHLARSRVFAGRGDAAAEHLSAYDAADGDQSLGIDGATSVTIARGDCSAELGFVAQLMRECRTCGLTFRKGLGVCDRCAAVCHAGHDVTVIPIPLPAFSCDCLDSNPATHVAKN